MLRHHRSLKNKNIIQNLPFSDDPHFPEWTQYISIIMNKLLADTLLNNNLESPLVQAETAQFKSRRLLPNVNVIKIGGQSFIDRGREAVFPIIEEIKQNLPHHQMMIGTGAGTRARHAYSVGIDQGMPTGVLGLLGTFVSIQNAKMIHYLLAEEGVPYIEPGGFSQMPLYLKQNNAVIFFGMPPYTYWQRNPENGKIPPYRTDTGCYLVSEAFGTKSMIYVKDEDGLYTDDPKKNKSATFIPKITASELIDMDLNDLIVERAVLDMMKHAKNGRQIQIINGLVPGNLTKALNGEHIGTIITSS
jgi:molybdenum storage protein